jgi:hypothetical protein
MTDAAIPDDPAAVAEQPEALVQVTPNDPSSVIIAGGETDDTRSARQRILDHLEDTEGPQHVSAIVQGTGLDRRVIDPILSRGVKSGLFLRVAEATYALAPPAPEPVPAPPEPQEMPSADGIPPAEWLSWLWAWYRSSRWEGPGRPPGRETGILEPGCAVPMDVFAQFQGELSAVLQQEAEDEALASRLIAHAAGNVTSRSPGLRDLRPIRIALASGVPLDVVEAVIRYKHDPRISPKNMPLRDWAELLPHIAEHFGRFTLAKKLLAKWRATMDNPHATTDASPTLRRAVAEITPETSAGAPDALPGAQEPAAAQGHQEAPAGDGDDYVPLADRLMLKFGMEPGDAPPDEAAPPPVDPLASGRASIAAGFKRRAASPSAPQPTAPVQPAADPRDAIAENLRQRRQEEGARPVTAEPAANRPWFAPAPSNKEEVPGLSVDEIDELVQAWKMGNIRWPVSILGEYQPGHPECRLSKATLRRNGL